MHCEFNAGGLRLRQDHLIFFNINALGQALP